MKINNQKKAAVIIGVGLTLSMFQNCSKVNFNPVEGSLAAKTSTVEGATAVGTTTSGNLVPITTVTVTTTPTSGIVVPPDIYPIDPAGETTKPPISSLPPIPTVVTQPTDLPPVVEVPEDTEGFEAKYCHFDWKHHFHFDDEKETQNNEVGANEGMSGPHMTVINDDGTEINDRNTWNPKHGHEDNGWHLGQYKEFMKKCLKIKWARHCQIRIDSFDTMIDIAQLSDNEVTKLDILKGKVLLYSSDDNFSLDNLKLGHDVQFAILCKIKVKNFEHEDGKEKYDDKQSKVDRDIICKAPEKEDEA